MASASFGLDHLARMEMPGNLNTRPTLLRVLTELYVEKPTHTAEEERHYTELALGLLDTADVGSRIAVAQRLAQYSSPPPRVVERLAREMKNSGGPPLWPAVSTFRDGRVADRAPIGTDVATELNELFFAASSEERRLILLSLDVIVPLSIKPTEYSREDSLGRRLEAAVLSRNREAFAQELAQALQISRLQARRIVDDELGEPIITAAKALNIRRGALYRILLFVNVGHRSIARVRALSELYHELDARAAEHMAAIWRALPKAEIPLERRQPLLWDDQSATRARMASAIANRVQLPAPPQRDAS